MSITKFRFDAELAEKFIDFGYKHYRNDKRWISPLRADLRALLAPEFSFYVTDGNYHRHFLARSGDRIVGRATATVNPELKDRDGTPVGAIGFFESAEVYGVAEALLDAAVDFLHREHHLNRIWGPMNFDIWHGYRFMTRGFDQEPFYGEPYNKPYYPDFFQRYGFTVKDEWDSLIVTGQDRIKNMIVRGEKRYRMLLDRGYRFEPINMDNWSQEMKKLHQVMTASFAGFLGCTPLSVEELRRMMASSRYAIDPDLFLFIYNENNDLAGFAAAFLELGDAVRAMNGDSGLLAKLRFLQKRRKADKMNFYIGGATPEELARRSGIGRAGFYAIINGVIEKGYETLMLTLRLKGNSAHGLAAKSETEPQREYALYELQL